MSRGCGTKGLIRLVFAVLLVLTNPWAAAGQDPGSRTDSAKAFTGPTLDPDHWAVMAVRRADALRLLEAHLPPQRAMSLDMVEAALREARDRASESRPELRGLTEAWHSRLLEEFSGIEGSATGDGPMVKVLGRRASVGLALREGATAPGLGEFEPHRTGAIPLPDETRPFAVGEASIGVGRHVALSARFEADAERVAMTGIEVAADLGRVRAALGRIPVGYAFGVGGGVVLSGHVPIDALQIGTSTPFRLPSVMKVVGPVSLHAFLGRMTEERHPGDPFTWGASGQIRPHPRLTFAVNRAAFFGGDRESKPITFRNVVGMLIGSVAGVGFEDQIVSVSGRFVLPTESVLPLTAYLEWGAEDAAGAWFDVPGQVFGLWAPTLPGVPEIAMGAEYARFATSCCGNPEWYRHWSFSGSWASRDRTLGHPLGGNGTQWTLYGSAELMDARVRLNARASGTMRDDQNLFSPGRSGRSHGIVAGLELRPRGGWQVRLDASHERGPEWDTSGLRMEVTHF